MKLLVILGTRPEAIKMAPVVHAARRRAAEGMSVQVLSTGQHRELLDPVLRHFDIQPDMDLGLMRPSQTLSGLTARAIEAIDAALAELAPDAVLVQGDTTTAMAGAVAAFYRGIPVGHVEAGLRTGNIRAPFQRSSIAARSHW
jgi:UDP-N-acetylglucosamine 2-epimerase (non-hydrolysing)